MHRSDYVVCSLLNQHISLAGMMQVLMLSASCAISHTLSPRRKKKGIAFACGFITTTQILLSGLHTAVASSS